MRYFSIIVLLFLGLIAFQACDDDPIIDDTTVRKDTTVIKESDTLVEVTIKDMIMVSEYFPAYCGSYWVYNNTDTVWVAEDYYVSGGHMEGADSIRYLEPVIIWPTNSGFLASFRINKNKTYVGNYDNCGLGVYGPGYEPLFLYRTDYFQRFGCNSDNSTGVETLVIDTTLVLNSIEYKNVIISIEYIDVYDRFFSKDSIWYLKTYFAKDIGIIWKGSRKLDSDGKGNLEYSNEQTLELTDYHIELPE